MGSVTKIVDRGGRRVRLYDRKTEGPTKKDRQAHAAIGEHWCRGCKSWHPDAVMRAGLCRPCASTYERERYHSTPDYRERRKANASRQRAKRKDHSNGR